MKHNRIIGSFKNTKAKTFEIIILSMCMALGINFIASGVMILVDKKSAVACIIIGIIISLFTFIVIFISWLKTLNIKEEIEGFFVYDEIEHEIIGIPEYEVSNDMEKYLNAAFVENEAIKSHWKSGGLNSFIPAKADEDRYIKSKASESAVLLVELLEYCILERLSTLICDYFNRFEEGENKTREYSRKDIADILLSNRFLNLFSEPVKNRSFFVDADIDDNVVLAYGPGGVIYSKFDLVLPAKSKIKRIDKNTLLIDMNGFTLKISCVFGGFNTFIEPSLHQYYIGCNDREEYSDYQFNINIEVKWKWKALFYFSDWKYYEWIDLFIDKLYEYADKKTFLQMINWNTTKALLRCMERKE